MKKENKAPMIKLPKLKKPALKILDGKKLKMPESIKNIEIKVPEAIKNIDIKVPEAIKNIDLKVPDLKNIELKVPEAIKNIDLKVPEAIKNIDIKVPNIKLPSQEKKVFSGLDNLPSGHASDVVISGCMVLEGGAFRGTYTSGVLDALMENDINLETTVGVSAGALNGLGYVAGQIGRCARINLEFRHDPRYIGAQAVRKNASVVGFDFILHGINEVIEPFDEERFFGSSRRYIAEATSCETGQPVFFEKGKCSDIYQAARASASMQILSKMVDVDGEKYLDGGASKRIPIQFALDENFEKIIVVRTRDREFRKEEKEAKIQAAYYRKYPAFAKALLNSDIEYNAECDLCDELEKQGKAFQIIPSEIVTVSRLEGDMEKLGALYYLGYNDAMNVLPQLKEYLGID